MYMTFLKKVMIIVNGGQSYKGTIGKKVDDFFLNQNIGLDHR